MKRLLLGDEAIAQGALDAGLSGVYAYPGTPSTEITEYIVVSPLAKAGIEINRKVLADLALNNPEAFKAIVAKVK